MTPDDPKNRALGRNCIRVIESDLISENVEAISMLPLVLSE